MKIFICLFLLWSTQVFAQNTMSRISMESPAFNDFFMNSTNLPVVKGKIINCTPEALKNIHLIYECIQPHIEASHDKQAPIAEDGSFQLELKYAFPYQQIFVWLAGRCFFQVYATKDVFIEIDMSQIPKSPENFQGQGITFSGTDGPFSTYLSRHFWYHKEQKMQLDMDQNKILHDTSVHLSEYYNALEHIFQQVQKLDSSFIAQNPSPYAWAIENIRTGTYLSNLVKAPIYKANLLDYQIKNLSNSLWEKFIHYQGYLVSNDCKEVYYYLYNIISTQIAYKYLEEFCNKLAKNEHLSANIRKTLEETIRLSKESRNDPALSPKISENYREIRDYFDEELTLWNIQKCLPVFDSLFPQAKADLIKLNLMIGEPSLQKKQIELLQQNIKTPWCLKILEDKYQIALEKIRKEQLALAKIQPLDEPLSPCQAVGQADFGARFYKVSDVSAEQFFAQLKKNFTNKALILDFWATWCGWCPNSLRLMNKHRQSLNNEAVEFIYLCTSASSNEERWKAKILQLRIPGIHIFVDSKLNRQLMQSLSIHEAYPSIAFFNKDGQYLPDAFPDQTVPDHAQTIKELLK